MNTKIHTTQCKGEKTCYILNQIDTFVSLQSKKCVKFMKSNDCWHQQLH